MQILRRPQVQERTGLPKSTLFQKVAEGNFPRPIKLGTRATGWLLEDVDRWIAERVAASKAVRS